MRLPFSKKKNPSYSQPSASAISLHSFSEKDLAFTYVTGFFSDCLLSHRKRRSSSKNLRSLHPVILKGESVSQWNTCGSLYIAPYPPKRIGVPDILNHPSHRSFLSFFIILPDGLAYNSHKLYNIIKLNKLERSIHHENHPARPLFMGISIPAERRSSRTRPMAVWSTISPRRRKNFCPCSPARKSSSMPPWSSTTWISSPSPARNPSSTGSA